MAWGLCALFIVIQLGPVLSNRQLAGWDLSAHYYLVHYMAELLRSGRLSGYDYNWYAGYPAFTLYAPLVYVLAALPNIISVGAVSTTFGLNLVLVLLPVLFLISLFVIARTLWGKEESIAALILGLLFLALPSHTAHIGLGLLGLIAVGLPASFLGAIFILWLIFALELLVRAPRSLPSLLLLAFTITCLILTHTLNTIFAVWTIGFYLIGRTGLPRVRVLISGLIGTILSSWWWIPFIQSLPYSSSVTLGIPGSHPDPLFLLFPDLFSRDSLGFLTLRRKFLELGIRPFSTVIVLPRFLAEFPVQAAVWPLATVFAVMGLLKKNAFFFPVFYFMSLLILPRNFLTEFGLEGLHTYRFGQPLFVLQTLIGSFGLAYLWKALLGSADTASARAGKMTACALGFILLTIALFHQFTLEPQKTMLYDPRTGSRSKSFTYRLFPEKYPEHKDAEAVLEYFATVKVRGRIAVDTARPLFNAIGSPHYLSTEIPLRLNVPAVPGLLAESALSAGYINPAMHGLATVEGWTDYMLWGRNFLVGLPEFRRSGAKAMIERLELYGIEYIVSALRSSDEVLSESPRAVEVFQSGRFKVFRLKDWQPLVQETADAPILFVDKGGVTFREFSELWFTETKLFKYPVVHSVNHPDALPLERNDRFSGYIVSWPKGKTFTDSDYDRLIALQKPVVVLNALPHDYAHRSSLVQFIPMFNPWAGLDTLTRFLGFQLGPSSFQEIKPLDISPNRIKVSSNELVLLNFSFHPRWESKGSSAEVYWLAPSRMAVFAAGETILEYR